MNLPIPDQLRRYKNHILLGAAAVPGVVLLLASLIRLLRLEQGAPPARVVIAMLMGATIMLAIALLRREGCNYPTLLLSLLPLGVAFFARAMCMDHITLDYTNFLSQWVEFFRDEGSLAAIRQSVGNYNVPYLYFLSIIAWLPVPDLYLIKLFSILFDVLLAWGCMRVVRIFRPQTRLPEAAFLLVLLLPTVVLNGALWAQCDSVYTALCLLSLASMLEGHPRRSVTFAALAFSFKLQAIFFLPILLVCWFTRRVNFRQLLFFPFVYFLSILPALLLGKPLADILGVYWGQVNTYTDYLTLNAPSLFALFPPDADPGVWSAVGIGLAGGFTLLVFGLLFLLRLRVNDSSLLCACTLLCLLIPFFLPHMHERYFMLAEVLTVTLACATLRHLYLPGLVQLAALGGYHAYLMLRYAFPMNWGTLMMLAALLVLCYELWWQMGRPTRIIPRLLHRTFSPKSRSGRTDPKQQGQQRRQRRSPQGKARPQ